MDTLQAIIMGLLQGLTEYLPVSSSGHLAIASHFFGIDAEANLSFTIAVHVATVCSTIVVLHKDIASLLSGLFSKPYSQMNASRHYVLNILVSMIPIGIVGLCFKDYVEEVFGSGLTIVGICLLLTALLLAFSYYAKPRPRNTLSPAHAFVIGLAQALAVLPGLSRSGSTIATGILLGNNKAQLAQFSFLMVIPPILGEALLDTVKAAGQGLEQASMGMELLPLTGGSLAAFISGCLACRWMVNLVRKGKLVWFALYCAIAGTALLAHSLI